MVKLKKLRSDCGRVVEIRPSFSVPVVPPASRPPLIQTTWVRRWESRGVDCANLRHLKRMKRSAIDVKRSMKGESNPPLPSSIVELLV
ncbi:uncharacterized [Tachysurus ichikawai]